MPQGSPPPLPRGCGWLVVVLCVARRRGGGCKEKDGRWNESKKTTHRCPGRRTDTSMRTNKLVAGHRRLAAAGAAACALVCSMRLRGELAVSARSGSLLGSQRDHGVF